MWKYTQVPGKSRTEPHGQLPLHPRGPVAVLLPLPVVGVPGYGWVPDGCMCGYQMGTCTVVSRLVQTSLPYPMSVRHVGQASQTRRSGQSDMSVGQSCQTCRSVMSDLILLCISDEVRFGALRNSSVSELGYRAREGNLSALRMF